MSKFRGVSAGDLDSAVDAESASGVGKEFGSALGAIEQDEVDLGLVDRHDQAGHSPAASEVTPTLARLRIGSAAVRPGMPKMGLNIAGS